MRITQVAKKIGATVDEVRYLEVKGYIEGSWMQLKSREVRDYSEAEVLKAELIFKYRRLGFELAAAYERAMEELRHPRLI